MGMVIKKRQILSATLVIALCAALTVNWYLTTPKNSGEEASVSDEAVSGSLGDTLFVAGTTAADGETQVNGQADEGSEEEQVSAEEYFASAKLSRQNTYDEVIDNIKEILDDGELTSEKENEISVMLSDYQSDMKVQTDVENLIEAKTGSECFVVINSDSCEVVLQKNTLTDSLVLQITEIIQKNANISAENLTIIELK